ncbi:MAG: hypothetical protein GY822_08225 [Deltaproteobacteria bacterium]|nr:hypothetical protein [Deltaproteobacteria bacterium]
MLAQAGVEKWSSPHEGARWSKASRALIDGDSLINCASPDGWAKLTAIRGPGTMFKDATVHESVNSAKQSYDDAVSVVSDGARPLAEAGLRRCEGAMKSVSEKKNDAWIFDQGERMPRTNEGKVAFWDAPLEYPPNADGSGLGLGKPAQASFDFAQELKDPVVQLLRDEQENV